ncbi:Proteasome subunit alpha type, partial [Caligus rogercresseyi]
HIPNEKIPARRLCLCLAIHLQQLKYGIKQNPSLVGLSSSLQDVSHALRVRSLRQHFSPEGRLFQAPRPSAFKPPTASFLPWKKRITSPLMEPSTIEKIVEVDKHLACAFSGLIPDSKMLIDKARVECQSHWVQLQRENAHRVRGTFGDSEVRGAALSRPFGVALLFAGIDEKGPQLYHMDPSGTYIRFDAKAIGSGSEGAQQSLQEKYHSSMSIDEAIKESMTILKQVMEEKLSDSNVEVATVTKEGGYKLLKGKDLEHVSCYVAHYSHFARSYAPAVVLPFAVVVGFVGYNLEGLLSDKTTPSRESVIERRELRRATEGEDVKFEVPQTIFERNVSPSLRKGD